MSERPELWDFVRVPDAFISTSPRVVKIQRSAYLKSGPVPVIDQGQSFIAGHWDKADDAFTSPLPVIIFGDHTRVFKFIDFPFVCGADGTKVLVPNTEKFDPEFLYYALSQLDIPSRGYNRHFKILSELSIPQPPKSEQQSIAFALRTVRQTHDATEQKRDALEQLYRSLLEELMSGRISATSINQDAQ